MPSQPLPRQSTCPVCGRPGDCCRIRDARRREIEVRDRVIEDLTEEVNRLREELAARPATEECA